MRWVTVVALAGLLCCGSFADGSPPSVAPPPSEPEPPSPTVEAEPPAPAAESAPTANVESSSVPEPLPPSEPTAPLWPAKWEPRIVAVQPLVAAAAVEHGVDPFLVNAVIWVESKFDRKARNRSGARGLMQLMPKTAKSLGRALRRPARIYDAEFNVQAGTYYLSRLLEQFDGDQTLALASYVRGPAWVRARIDRGEPFPDGVQGFIDKVERARSVFAARGWPEGVDERSETALTASSEPSESPALSTERSTAAPTD